jgi:hypothetical protein
LATQYRPGEVGWMDDYQRRQRLLVDATNELLRVAADRSRKDAPDDV